MMTDSEKLDAIYNWMLNCTSDKSPAKVSCDLPFEVYPTNLPVMTYVSAVKAVEKLGDGWRIPTLAELKLMYKNKGEIGGFITEASGSVYPVWYWSSTPNRAYTNLVDIVRFSDGIKGWDSKDYYRLSCRPVRLVAAAAATSLGC